MVLARIFECDGAVCFGIIDLGCYLRNQGAVDVRVARLLGTDPPQEGFL